MLVLDREKSITIKVGEITIKQGSFTMIAGPCAVESEAQLDTIFNQLNGVDIVRGGVFKPRTSPYAFQGLRGEGIDLLLKMAKKYNKPVISEIMSIDQIEFFNNVDMIQIGARNMQNFELLKAVARLNKPILLKRGMGNTVEEFISSAEYILSEGNDQVIFCERGIRTFENSTRFTLDIAAIEVIKQKTNFPVFIDPSHAAGESYLVPSLTKAAIAAGCDGIIIEVHPNPSEALSDANQQLTIEEYNNLVEDVNKLLSIR